MQFWVGLVVYVGATFVLAALGWVVGGWRGHSRGYVQGYAAGGIEGAKRLEEEKRRALMAAEVFDVALANAHEQLRVARLAASWQPRPSRAGRPN